MLAYMYVLLFVSRSRWYAVLAGSCEGKDPGTPMKSVVAFVSRLVLVAVFSALVAGCIAPGGWGAPMYGGGWGGGRAWGPGFAGNGWGGGGWQQPFNVQPGGNFVGPNGAVQGNWSQTYQAAQFRAQQQAAGAAPPVGAYQNPNMPLGYVVGTGQPTWSANQCWQQGCVIP